MLLKYSGQKLACGLALLVSTSAMPAGIETAQKTIAQAHQSTAAVQRKINQLDEQQYQDYAEYASLIRQSEMLEAYNQELQQLLESQQQEQQELEQQLISLEQTEQAVLPLLRRMTQTLKQFVAADLPFLPLERSERLKRLEALLSRADVSVAEKYRQLLEAYQIEAEYGRTLEAYNGVLPQAGQNREVTFVRLGRVALFYQTADAQASGRWNRETSVWEAVDAEASRMVQRAIRMARRQSVPELLLLPLTLQGERP